MNAKSSITPQAKAFKKDATQAISFPNTKISDNYNADNSVSPSSSLLSFSNLKFTTNRIVLRKNEDEEYGFSINRLVIHTNNENKLKYQVWFKLTLILICI
jgi:hypothetical protein